MNKDEQLPVASLFLNIEPFQDQRRRLLSSNSILYKGQGIYYAFLYVGTPPQRVSVIVDTGSHHMAFPCKGCRCGAHMDPYFDPLKSSTSVIKDCHGMKCFIKQSYTEGSSWHAYLVSDQLWLGDSQMDVSSPNKMLRLPFSFGCQDQESGLFRTQHIDGIMGLSAHDDTLPFRLFAANKTSSRAFSICLSPKQGQLALGGINPLVESSSWKFIKLIKDRGWFTVKLLGLYFKDKDGKLHHVDVDLSHGNKAKGTIIDSGTTDTYLPSAWKDKVSRKFHEISGQNIGKSLVTISKTKYNDLPTIVYRFEGKNQLPVDIECAPSSYVDQIKSDVYSFRVYLTESSGVVLGSNFMMNYNILFDVDHQQIAIASSNCSTSPLPHFAEDLNNTQEISNLMPSSSIVDSPSSIDSTEMPSLLPLPSSSNNNTLNPFSWSSLSLPNSSSPSFYPWSSWSPWSESSFFSMVLLLLSIILVVAYTVPRLLGWQEALSMKSNGIRNRNPRRRGIFS